MSKLAIFFQIILLMETLQLRPVIAKLDLSNNFIGEKVYANLRTIYLDESNDILKGWKGDRSLTKGTNQSRV